MLSSYGNHTDSGSPGNFDTGRAEPRWVETTRKLESSPLDADLISQGEAALKRVIEVHDVHVGLCGGILNQLNGKKYAYSNTITRQFMLAAAAFVIENPDKAADMEAVNFAAVESVLKTYQAILKQKTDAKSKSLDELLKKQGRGKLKDSLKKCP